MNDENIRRQFSEKWDRAVERAAQDKRSDSDLEEEALNDAAGLHVQSGVKGGWTSTCSCDCSGIIIC